MWKRHGFFFFNCKKNSLPSEPFYGISLALSTSTVLYNHHFCLVPEYFLHLGQKPQTHEAVASCPSPQPLATTNLLSFSTDLPILDHINGIIRYVAFRAWLLSVSMMISRFIRVIAWICASFFPKIE